MNTDAARRYTRKGHRLARIEPFFNFQVWSEMANAVVGIGQTAPRPTKTEFLMVQLGIAMPCARDHALALLQAVLACFNDAELLAMAEGAIDEAFNALPPAPAAPPASTPVPPPASLPPAGLN